jgi:RNA polymerase sigma-70 factor (ECF subfamily)
MNTTPASLLERLQQPDQQAAWARFADLYTPLIYYWARRAGLQPPEASDLVQEVFVVLLRRLPDFHYDRKRSFRSWLRTVTLNKWRELHRRVAVPARTVDIDNLDVGSLEGGDPFADEEYRRLLTGRALEVMQAEFEPATWKAFWECTVEERPAAEVARQLGISTNAVYIAKSRVLTRLRQELQGLWE